jgi:hypothetical protein
MGYIVPAFVFMPIGAALRRYSCIDRPLKIIFCYLLLDGTTNVIAVTLAHFNMHNLPLLHIFTILEFLLLSWFFLEIFHEQRIRRIIVYMMVIFPLLCVINFTFFQSINRFNTNTRPLEALILMAYSLLFSVRANEKGDKKWSGDPISLVNTGILLYFSGALFIFSFSNITSGHPIASRLNILNLVIWDIHATLVLAMYLLFTLGMLKCKRI